MRFEVEINDEKGLSVAAELNPLMVKVLAPIVASGFSLPWLVQLAQAMGWL